MLIGFDAREAEELEPRWDERRRQLALLRRDVVRPLSAGTSAWPSLFDTGEMASVPEPERRKLGYTGIPLPDRVGGNAYLWDDLERMRTYLNGRLGAPASAALVAVGWLSRQAFREAGEYGPYADPVEPPEPQPDWKLIGYDIADGSLWSILSECGWTCDELAYTADQFRAFVERWTPALNEHHLFDDASAAFEFASLCDQRIPDPVHAPFCVYSLYQLPN
jgi:hypothetical protein